MAFFPKLPLSPKQPYWTTNSFVIEHFNRSDPWNLWTIRQKLQKSEKSVFFGPNFSLFFIRKLRLFLQKSFPDNELFPG